MDELAKELTMTDRLTGALQRAAGAHGQHEEQIGHPDPDWPSWYAEHMTRTLAEEGYRPCRSDPLQRRP
jgi:hypothetical protein